MVSPGVSRLSVGGFVPQLLWPMALAARCMCFQWAGLEASFPFWGSCVSYFGAFVLDGAS